MPLAIPTLDQVQAEPRTLAGLPIQVLRMIRMRALSVAHLAEIEEMGALPAAPTSPDEVLPLPEAARRLGLSPVTLQHRARRHPYAALLVDNGTRRLVFSAQRIAEYLAQSRPGSPRPALAPAGGRKESRLARPPIPPRVG